MANQRCISLDSPTAWKSALKGVPHAFGHTWESCYAMAQSSGFNTYLYCWEGEHGSVLCPFSERPYGEFVDITTPYGFSGFTGIGPCQGFIQDWRAFAQRQGYVCGYIGLNPLLAKPEHFEPDSYDCYNSLYMLDLTQSEAALFAKLSSNRKRQVKRWQQAVMPYDKSQMVAFFMAHYHDFMAQRKAANIYQFSRETLNCLLDLDQVFLVGAGTPDRLEAVSVFAYTSEIAEFLFNVSIPEGKRHSVALIWGALKRLQALGIGWLNLGGGIREGDSLAEFKARFGAQQQPLAALKQVYQPALYQALCQQAAVDAENRSGYFPPYRRAMTARSAARPDGSSSDLPTGLAIEAQAAHLASI